MKTTKLSYLAAKTNIAEVAAHKQTQLDQAAALALATVQDEYRALALGAVTPEDILYPVAVVLSEGYSVTPRESDGYPECILSKEANDVLLAARNAGLPVAEKFAPLVTVTCYQGARFFSPKQTPAWRGAYDTWREAREYRANQTHASL